MEGSRRLQLAVTLSLVFLLATCCPSTASTPSKVVTAADPDQHHQRDSAKTIALPKQYSSQYRYTDIAENGTPRSSWSETVYYDGKSDEHRQRVDSYLNTGKVVKIYFFRKNIVYNIDVVREQCRIQKLDKLPESNLPYWLRDSEFVGEETVLEPQMGLTGHWQKRWGPGYRIEYWNGLLNHTPISLKAQNYRLDFYDFHVGPQDDEYFSPCKILSTLTCVPDTGVEAQRVECQF